MRPIRFIHISDTHLGAGVDYRLSGVHTHDGAANLLQQVRELPFTPDFIVHTGDIFSGRPPAASDAAIDLFRALPAPVFFVAGNHDDAESLAALPSGFAEPLPGGAAARASTWSVRGHRFLSLNLQVEDPESAEGEVTPHQLALVDTLLSSGDEPWSVFVHFPLLTVDCPWIDREMLAREGLALHRVLARYAPRIHGVFGGHIHRAMQIHRDGVLYCTAASSAVQFHAYPGDESPLMDLEAQPGFNIVTIVPGQTIVKSMTFNRPAQVRA